MPHQAISVERVECHRGAVVAVGAVVVGVAQIALVSRTESAGVATHWVAGVAPMALASFSPS
jgi:hypothetical protein